MLVTMVQHWWCDVNKSGDIMSIIYFSHIQKQISIYQLTVTFVSGCADKNAVIYVIMLGHQHHGADNGRDIMPIVYIDHTSKSDKW